MIDYFALGLTNALLALAAWRLIQRSDLDNEPPEAQAAATKPDKSHA